MTVSKKILCLVVLLSFGVLCAQAQENAATPPPPKYKLELMYVFDVGSHEYFFVIGKTGFKSVAALKKFLGSLTPGSILEWDPGCIRMGGEPLLSSAEDMEDFKAFCVANNIKFIVLPAG